MSMKFTRIFPLPVLLASLAACAPKARTLLIVNGDDVGIAPDFTDATIAVFDKGGLSCVSLVAPGHDAERAISILKGRPEIPVGAHLTLTGDWAPLSPGASLRGPDGNMWETSREAGTKVKAEEAAAEWEAQIRKLLDGGLELTHIDSHMGCYFERPELFEAAFRAARKFNIPMVSPDNPYIPEKWKSAFPFASYSGIYFLPTGTESSENRAMAYWELLGSLEPGIHYLFSHHLLGAKEEVASGDRRIRIDDSKFWTNPAVNERLAGMGIERVSPVFLKAEFKNATEGMK